jgi:CRISPR type III-B/RAMP module-associated protein Cmr3
MSVYLMRLTPQEPYFFGNEKTFNFPGSTVVDKQNRYFIMGEKIPTQTTLIGTLRYILLPVKKEFGAYEDDEKVKNGEAVGDRSFQYGSENKFGKIKGMSPVFLLKGNERLIPTPFDHTVIIDKKETTCYMPFEQYEPLGLNAGKEYPTAYNAKNGITSSFLNIDESKDGKKTGSICQPWDIFKTDVRVGINREAKRNGFFKKEYVALEKEYSFGVYVELADDLIPQNSVAYVAYMGQGKSLFTVSFERVEDDAPKKFYKVVGSFLRDGIAYCLSDVFAETTIYDHVSFAITDTRDYRAYTTNDGKVTKDSKLYKLIRAGSIFKTNTYEEFIKDVSNPNVEVIGYNKIVSKIVSNKGE